MPERRNSMMDPPIEELLDRVDSKFTLVALAAKRGREINSYFNQLGEGLGALAPPQVTSLSRKPLSIALEEVAARKVVVAEPATSQAADEVLDLAPVGSVPAPTDSGLHRGEPEDLDATESGGSGEGNGEAPITG